MFIRMIISDIGFSRLYCVVFCCCFQCV